MNERNSSPVIVEEQAVQKNTTTTTVNFCESYCGEGFYPGCYGYCMGCSGNPENLY